MVNTNTLVPLLAALSDIAAAVVVLPTPPDPTQITNERPSNTRPVSMIAPKL